MRVFSPSLFAVLAQLATFCLAIPLELTPRTLLCSNAPNTIAGSLLDRATTELGSTDGGVWCAPRSQTWVLITFVKNLSGTIATEILIDSYNIIDETIRDKGDGPIINGLFELVRYGLVLKAKNANNHQMTRAVLEAAITATWQYMRHYQYSHGGQGMVTFKIFDGVNQVGVGSIAAAKSS